MLIRQGPIFGYNIHTNSCSPICRTYPSYSVPRELAVVLGGALPQCKLKNLGCFIHNAAAHALLFLPVAHRFNIRTSLEIFLFDVRHDHKAGIVKALSRAHQGVILVDHMDHGRAINTQFFPVHRRGTRVEEP